MNDGSLQMIDVERLRIGMFVHLDVGWMDHPFPFGSFKIKSQDQIETIRSLGMRQVRVSARMSDAQPADAESATRVNAVVTSADEATEVELIPEESPEQSAKREHQALLSEQQASLDRCERNFRDASRNYRQVLQNAYAQPAKAAEDASRVIDSMFAEMAHSNETAIRLLSEKAGEESALHALNVTVLSLLLARSCGLDEAALRAVGTGALLHDIGKLELPDRLRWHDPKFSAVERRLFEDHAIKGVALAERMSLGPDVCAIIAQHHERDDGTGYPAALAGTAICAGARIVALVNQYDNYCNPGNPAQALTPHDALAVMFAKMRTRFDAATMSTFIRMMGVYPPGSVVQLTDSRYAISVSVNASRPLKPRVIVYDDSTTPEDALVIDLEATPDLGVRRSLKPVQLPRAVFDYLSPRKRMCYFFERSRDGHEDGHEDGAVEP